MLMEVNVAGSTYACEWCDRQIPGCSPADGGAIRCAVCRESIAVATVAAYQGLPVGARRERCAARPRAGQQMRTVYGGTREATGTETCIESGPHDSHFTIDGPSPGGAQWFAEACS